MKAIFCPFFLLLFWACESPSDKIAKAFKTVNASLERNNQLLASENELSASYLKIQEKAGSHPDWAQKADSLYQSVNSLNKILSRTTKDLTDKDPEGTNTKIGSRLLTKTLLGDSIRSAVSDLIRRCHTSLVSAGKDSIVDSNLQQADVVIDPERWNGPQFVGYPSAAARMTLEYIKLQCTETASFVLKDMSDQMSK